MFNLVARAQSNGHPNPYARVDALSEMRFANHSALSLHPPQPRILLSSSVAIVLDCRRDRVSPEMESAAKRKAASAAAPENEGRPAKRQKPSVSACSGATC
jgi:hypothetical protein